MGGDSGGGGARIEGEGYKAVGMGGGRGTTTHMAAHGVIAASTG